jgi:hypothetical protein
VLERHGMTIDLAVGSELAGHRIEAVIGRGGMGVVYLAHHLRLGRRAALKVLAPELADDEVFRERFIRESQLAAALEHPNIVPIYDAGEAQDVLYISMRYVEGADLAMRLRQERVLPPEQTVAILEQVASALDAAHQEDLVHRDVKPANILIESRSGAQRVFLTDFGITKSLRREGQSLTRSGQMIGTIDYMAPEQIASGPVDPRADVYSLGCIAYRCLTGTVPFPRDHEVAVIYAHLQDIPPEVTSMRPELPDAVDTVVRTAMAKSPDARFATCSEFVDALRPHLAGAAEMSTTARVAGPARADTQADTKPRARPSTGQPPRKRRRVRWAAAAATVAAAGAVVALLLLNRGHPAPSTSRTESPPPPVLAIMLTWNQISLNQHVFGGAGDQVINRAIPKGTGILAVGYQTVRGATDAAVWSGTEDPSDWAKVSSGGGPGNQGMASVAEGGPGYVAVGSDDARGSYDAAVWTSTTGAVWERVPPRKFAEPGDQQMRRVVKGGPGAVAVGYDGDYAAVWVFDGHEWSPQTSAAFGEAGHEEQMWSVTMLGRTLVAVGSDCSGGVGLDCSGGDLDAAVWTSTDGLRWNRESQDSLGGSGDQQMTTVIPGGPGLVAVGYDTHGRDRGAAVWTSKDGTQWSLVPDTTGSLGGPGDQEMKGIDTIDGTLVAGGSDGSDAAVWTSIGGITWTKLDLPSPGGSSQQIKSLVAVGQTVIAVGFEVKSPHDHDAAVWVATVTPASPTG